MNSHSIDLGAPPFWLFLAVVLVVLVPLRRPDARRIAIAGSNLAFIALLTAPWGALAAAVFALLLRGVVGIAEAFQQPRARRVAAVALGASVTLALFLVHKLAASPHDDASQLGGRALLAAVGFSYVALRTVELLRAGWEGKTASFGWIDCINYLFPFHMMAAGPIQSWRDFAADRALPPPLTTHDALDAIDRIVTGLFKKFVLARAIEVAFLTSFRAPWPYLLLEIQAYYLWVYLDFSAYSDIAVGIGALIGISTPENFNHPLGARNIIVFWERWHISLSSFVRRNIFIPLQLSLTRRSRGAHRMLIASVAFAASFLLIGLWHELSLRFLLWGTFHAIALIMCYLFQQMLIARIGRKGLATYMANPTYRLLATLLTFEFVALSLAFIVHPATVFLG